MYVDKIIIFLFYWNLTFVDPIHIFGMKSVKLWCLKSLHKLAMVGTGKDIINNPGKSMILVTGM